MGLMDRLQAKEGASGVADLRAELASEFKEAIETHVFAEFEYESVPEFDDEAAELTYFKDKLTEGSRVVLAKQGKKYASLKRAEIEEVLQAALDDMCGFGPLQYLIDQEEISEIMVNGPKQIFVERKGKLVLSEVTFADEAQVLHVIKKIVAPLGRRCDQSMPLVDARLPNGSRVNAVIPPIALCGSTITIRKFKEDPLKIPDLIGFGSLTQAMADFLEACVRIKLNIVVSGGTGSGKTTTLNALSGMIPPGQRIITVEDAAELQLQQDHVISLETRPPNVEGKGAITIRDLIKNSLRMRPERIIVGECRGGEALDMLQSMNTGNDGSLTTGHANSPKDMCSRLETMVMMAGMDLPSKVIREQIGSAVNLIVQQNRLHDGSRRITAITEVDGLDDNGHIRLHNIFEWRQEGVDPETHKILGKLVPTGYVPGFLLRFKENGVSLPDGMLGEGIDVNGEIARRQAQVDKAKAEEHAHNMQVVARQMQELAEDKRQNPQKYESLKHLPTFRWMHILESNMAMVKGAKDKAEDPAAAGGGGGLMGRLAVRKSESRTEDDEEAERLREKGIRSEIQTKLALAAKFENFDKIEDEDRKVEVYTQKIEALIRAATTQRGISQTRSEFEAMTQRLLDEVMGFGALQELLDDEGVSEIMVNGPNKIFVENRGKLTLTDVTFPDNESVMHVVQKIVAPLGRRCDESCPLADARLPDGSRVNAVIPPVALNGPTLTIRRFAKEPLTVAKLVGYGSMTPEMAEFIKACVLIHLNIVISGGTGSGKTTTLNAVSGFIEPDERIVTVEDAAELQLQQDHVVPLETRPPNVEGKGAVTIRDLIKNTLRMRPERVIVGECRGGEALDMLQAMNTGHDGSLTTGHANSPKDMVSRIETMVMMAGMDLPSRVIREQIGSAVHLIIQQNRLHDGSRKITHLTEVCGLDENGQVNLRNVFEWKQYGTDERGKIIGALEPTGYLPTFMLKFRENNIPLPGNLFGESMDVNAEMERLERDYFAKMDAERAEIRKVADAQKAEIEEDRRLHPERYQTLDQPPFSWRDTIEKNRAMMSSRSGGGDRLDDLVGQAKKQLADRKKGLLGALARKAGGSVGAKTKEQWEELKKTIASQIMDLITHDMAMGMGHKETGDRDEDKKALGEIINQHFQALKNEHGYNLNRGQTAELFDEMLAEMVGFGALQPLLEDPAVSEIMINGPEQIFVERKGKLTLSEIKFRDEASVQHVIQKIISPLGRRCDISSPLVDARLPDGSRVNAVIPPIALCGSTITIRRFSEDPFTIWDLVNFGSLTKQMAEFIQACVEIHLNIVVSGGTGSGKTTTLNAISGFIHPDERIVTVEDAAELQLQQEHVVPLETRPANVEGKGAVTIRDLIKNTLRMRPERVIVGECRGGEALDMLQAMNTGHDGSLTTGHANSPKDMVSRLETMVMMAGMDLPSKAIREQIASAVHLIVQQNRLHDGARKITHLTEVVGLTDDGQVQLVDIFRWQQYGEDENGKIVGELAPTGAVPKFLLRFAECGIELPEGTFGPNVDIKVEMARLEREVIQAQKDELDRQKLRAQRRKEKMEKGEQAFSFEAQRDEAERHAALLEAIDEDTSFEQFQRIQSEEAARQLTANAGQQAGDAGYGLGDGISEEDVVRADEYHAGELEDGAAPGGHIRLGAPVAGALEAGGSPLAAPAPPLAAPPAPAPVAAAPTPPAPPVAAAPPAAAPPAPAPQAGRGALLSRLRTPSGIQPAPAPPPAAAPLPRPVAAAPPRPPAPPPPPASRPLPPPPPSPTPARGVPVASPPSVVPPRPAPVPPPPPPRTAEPAAPRSLTSPGLVRPRPPESAAPPPPEGTDSEVGGTLADRLKRGGAPKGGGGLMDRLRKK